MRNKVLYLQLCLLFIISSLPVQKAQAGEKDTPTEELNELSAKYVADSVSLSQSYFYLTYLIGKELSEENFRTMQAYFDELQKQGKKAVLRFAYATLWDGRLSVLPANRYWRTWIN